MNHSWRYNDEFDDEKNVGDFEEDLKEAGLTIFKSKGSPHQRMSVNDVEVDYEFNERYTAFLESLSPQQKKLVELITEGCSIQQAAKRMKISRDTAYEYWSIIRSKSL